MISHPKEVAQVIMTEVRTLCYQEEMEFVDQSIDV
jgi:hypothetical protein